MLLHLSARAAWLLSFGTGVALVIGTTRQFCGLVVPLLDDVIFDTLGLAEFPVPSLSRCLLSCSQDARCVSVFYQESRGQCRLQGGRFYLAQGGREEQGWRYYLMEMDPRCPALSGYIHRRDLSLCYRLEFQVGATHSEAVSNCTQEGGHLLRIDFQEKQDHIIQQIESSNATAVDYAVPDQQKVHGYYIDGQLVNDSWLWPSSGQQMTFSNWHEEEGVRYSVRQLFVALGGENNWAWFSVREDRVRSYICEIDV